MLHEVRCATSALPGLRMLDLRSDRRFPRHAHDQYGVGVMLDGGHRSWSGRGPIEVGPDCVITVNPNELHDGIPIHGASRRWSMIFIDPRVVAEVAGAEVAGREFPSPAIADRAFARRVVAALRDLRDGDAMEAAEIVVALFGALLDPARDGETAAPPSRGVRLMLERIHDDPAEAPSLMELATLAGLSAYTALRRFRREVGTTPHAYVVQYRVRCACRAICDGNTLTEAAIAAGFADQSHMTRAFVRQLGVTPGRWRP